MAWFEPLITVLALHGALAGDAPRLRIGLTLDTRLPPAAARHAVEESAAVWAPYHVDVAQLNAATPCGTLDAIDAVLTVTADARRLRPAGWSSPFASIRFLSDGRPEDAIVVHEQAITSLALESIVINGTRESQWPRALRDRIYGRIVGRVIAHEIGHWLLSRGHSVGGLMRAMHTAHDLAAIGREPFELTASDRARLNAVLAARHGQT
jgi:hypothetical protein